MPSYYFDHEKLRVYQEQIAFIAWLQPILQRVPKGEAVRDQLDRMLIGLIKANSDRVYETTHIEYDVGRAPETP